jgi:hypothetical protein
MKPVALALPRKDEKSRTGEVRIGDAENTGERAVSTRTKLSMSSDLRRATYPSRL